MPEVLLCTWVYLYSVTGRAVQFGHTWMNNILPTEFGQATGRGKFGNQRNFFKFSYLQVLLPVNCTVCRTVQFGHYMYLSLKEHKALFSWQISVDGRPNHRNKAA